VNSINTVLFWRIQSLRIGEGIIHSPKFDGLLRLSANHSLYHIKLLFPPLSWGKLRKKPATSRFDESFVPLATSEKRFARHHFCGPPPEVPLASSWAAKVHQLSGPTRKTQMRRLWFLNGYGDHLTPHYHSKRTFLLSEVRDFKTNLAFSFLPLAFTPY